MAVDNIARALAGKALNTENINKKSDVGQNLTVKFADEIKGYSDEWAWAKARRNAGKPRLRVSIPIQDMETSR